MCVITHSIHPVTEKSVLMCNCLSCHSLHTEKLRISNVSESIISGSSVPISSSSVSLSGSSSQKVWISSYSDTEEEENIDTDDPESIDSYIL